MFQDQFQFNSIITEARRGCMNKRNTQNSAQLTKSRIGCKGTYLNLSIYPPLSGLAIVNDVLIIRIMLALSMSQAQLDSYCGVDDDDDDGWHRHGYDNCIQKNISEIRLVFWYSRCSSFTNVNATSKLDINEMPASVYVFFFF